MSNKDSEITLLERQIDDLKNRPDSTTSDQLIDKAGLTLHAYGDERTPKRISTDNIWRWYYLRHITVLVKKR